MDTFYAALSGLCFVLLGFWWVVLQFKHDEWVRDAYLRRLAYSHSMYFLLPGTMALLALISDAPLVWRATFAVGGVIGAVESLQLALQKRAGNEKITMRQITGAVVLLIYLAVVFFAISPESAAALGLQPLAVEAILLAVLIFIGVQVVWMYFAEPPKGRLGS